MNCHTCQSGQPELLLDPTSMASIELRAHVDSCADCREEFRSYQETFALLDAWQAPEPSAYFDQKLAVRLREEAMAARAGFFERLKAHLLFNTGRQFRPALIGAMALAFAIGGGTFASVSSLSDHHKPQISAAVDDLQILDRNDQALQQMDQLLQEDVDDNPPLT